MDDLSASDRKNIWHPFTPLQGAGDPLLISAGEGVYLHTPDGRKILDAVSSWWVNLHGHCHPEIAAAIGVQAKKLEHVIFAGFTHEPAIRLSENLLTILPPNQKKIFFSDNGSTAVEVGLKMSFQYWHNQGIRKTKVVAINGAYHGDTFGSMSVAERGPFTEPFSPFLFQTAFIDFPEKNNEKEVLRQFKDLLDGLDVAAFIFEPLIQAAAGMRIYPAAILDKLIALAHEQGVVCIADEVFTGFGRTGNYFASDYLVNKPDIMAVSKGITGGFLPLGVTSCSEQILSAFDSPEFTKTFFHGHSYTANPLACAAANASFRLLTDGNCLERIAGIAKKHNAFAAQLAGDPNVSDVRTLGTVLAIELRSAEGTEYSNSLRKKIYPYFLERDILLRPLGNIIYVLPPYPITDEQLDHIYNSIRGFIAGL
ncbi:MAG TPA: adenosylmethionine--8-amino-7-oxononanoate transaminase [Chryseosolibacter sp.]